MKIRELRFKAWGCEGNNDDALEPLCSLTRLAYMSDSQYQAVSQRVGKYQLELSQAILC
jgi:hypothetical protein